MSKMESFQNAAVKSKEVLGKGARDTWEGAKLAGKDIREKTKNAKDAVVDSAIYKKVSGAASEWKDDMVETIKLKTVDKWKMMAGRGAENWLLQRKNSDIDKVDGKITNAQGSINLKEEDFKREEESINAAMAKISDPKFKEIFESGKVGKKAEMEREIETIRNGQLKQLEERKALLVAQKERYETNIKNIEKKFTDKIDNKINGIRDKYDYEGKMGHKKTLDENVKRLNEKMAEKEKGIADCEVALANKQFLTKEDQKRIKERAKEIKKEVAECRKDLERAEKARDKNDRQIGKINGKTQKWETMKTKYGLNKGEKVAIEEGVDKSGAEDIKTTTPTEEQKRETKAREDFVREGGFKTELKNAGEEKLERENTKEENKDKNYEAAVDEFLLVNEISKICDRHLDENNIEAVNQEIGKEAEKLGKNHPVLIFYKKISNPKYRGVLVENMKNLGKFSALYSGWAISNLDKEE